MITYQPSAVVQQLFEWLHESLDNDAETTFNTRLLRYGRAYTTLLREYEPSYTQNESTPSEVLVQVLDGYQELYQVALSRNRPAVYRNRLAQSLEYGFRIAIENNSIPTVETIAEQYQSLLKLELKNSTSEQTARQLVKGLENSFLRATMPLTELETSDTIERDATSLLICHAFINELMELAIEYDAPQTLSALFKLYEENLDTEDILRRIRKKEREEPELARQLRSEYKPLVAYELIRPLDLLGRAFQASENDSQSRQDSIEILEGRLLDESTLEELIQLFFNYTAEDLDISSSGNLVTLTRVPLLRNDPKSKKWRARAFALESIRLCKPTTDFARSPSTFEIPSSESDQRKLERINNALKWVTIDRAAALLSNMPSERELQARLFMLAGRYEDAQTTAEEAAYRSFIEASLEPKKIEEYVLTHSKASDDTGLPALLRTRGIIQTKRYDPGNNGVPVVQYLEPKVRFLDDQAFTQIGSSPSTRIQTGYNRCLIERLFQMKTCTSEAVLEREIKSTLRQNVSSNPILVISTMSDTQPLSDERSFDEIGDPYDRWGYVPTWNSYPIFRAPLPDVDAVVVYGSTPRLVEFHPPTGLYRFDVQTCDEARINPRLNDMIDAVTSEKVLITARVQFGVRDGCPVGVAFH